MRKKILLISMLLITLSMTACVKGKEEESAINTKYQILLNNSSCFVYTFQDSKTGVWYIASSHGVTSRLNKDGSLYITDN